MAQRPGKVRKTTSTTSCCPPCQCPVSVSPEVDVDVQLRDDVMLCPLVFDLILENMFKFCTPEALNACRLVCKRWYQVSSKAWLKNGHPIRLEEKKRGRDAEEVGVPSLSKFMKERRQSLQRKKLEITGIQKYQKFNLIFPKNPQWIGSTLEECGPWITLLKVEFHRPTVNSLLDVFSCRYTPVLAQLQVEICCSDFSEDVEENGKVLHGLDGGENASLKSLKIFGELLDFPVDWNSLFNYYPNLKDFCLNDCNVDNDLDKILSAIGDIRRVNKKKLDLKSLTWYTVGEEYNRGEDVAFPDTLLPLLRDAQLGLETLGVCFTNTMKDTDVCNVLTMHGETLKNLAFYRNPPLENSPFGGARLAQIRTLTIGGYAFENLCFLKDLPNLISLTLIRDKAIKYPKTTIMSAMKDMEIVALPALTIFRCNYRREWTKSDLRILRDMMPNLVRIDMRLSNSNFRAICGYWPRLEHVSVYGARVGDDGLVGYVKRKNGVVCFREPNISSLHYLRSFNMVNHIGGHFTSLNSTKLTKHSVEHGFLKLPNLAELTIDTFSKYAAVFHAEKIKTWILEDIPFAKVRITRF